MKVVIENVRTFIYTDGEPTEVGLTIEIDTDRLSDAARKAHYNLPGVATWANGAIRAFIQDEVPE